MKVCKTSVVVFGLYLLGYTCWVIPGGGRGVRARPGTLIHPYLDKIFTKWVAIKDLDISPTQDFTRIPVRIFLEGSRGPYLIFFSLFLDLEICEMLILGPEKTPEAVPLSHGELGKSKNVNF